MAKTFMMALLLCVSCSAFYPIAGIARTKAQTKDASGKEIVIAKLKSAIGVHRPYDLDSWAGANTTLACTPDNDWSCNISSISNARRGFSNYSLDSKSKVNLLNLSVTVTDNFTTIIYIGKKIIARIPFGTKYLTGKDISHAKSWLKNTDDAIILAATDKVKLAKYVPSLIPDNMSYIVYVYYYPPGSSVPRFCIYMVSGYGIPAARLRFNP